MAIPTTRAELMIDRAWSNVTADVFARNPIVITRGRTDEASLAEPSTCKLTLNNAGGKYSWRNPVSPLYGKIGRNTPMRFGVGSPPIAAVATSSVPSTSLVAPSVTAESTGLLLAVWAAKPTAAGITPPAGFTTFTQTDNVMSVRRAFKTATAGATGTLTATHGVTATEQATLTVHFPGGASGTNTAGSSASGQDLFASSFSATEGDFIVAICGWSADPNGRMQPPQVSTPVGAGWWLIADTGPSAGIRLACWARRSVATESSAMLFAGPRDGSTGTFVAFHRVTGASAYYPRHVGEVASWPQATEPGGRDVSVSVTSSGVLRRLGQGTSPLRSALQRLITTSPNVLAYWPLEDSAGSTSFASPLTGVAPAKALGSPALGADSGFDGSEPLPTWAAAGLAATVPPYASTAQVMAGALVAIPASGTADGSTLISVDFQNGTIAKALLEYKSASGGNVNIRLFDALGVDLLGAPVGTTSLGADGSRFFAWFTLSVPSPGAPVDYQIAVLKILNPPTLLPQLTTVSSSFGAGLTVGVASRVLVGVGPTGLLTIANGVTVGHVVVGSVPNTLFRTDATTTGRAAVVGHVGEPAVDRVLRLCTEQSVACQVPYGSTSTAMGAQRPGTLRDLLDQCAASDGGELYEPTGFIGLAYRPRSTLINQRGV